MWPLRTLGGADLARLSRVEQGDERHESQATASPGHSLVSPCERPSQRSPAGPGLPAQELAIGP